MYEIRHKMVPYLSDAVITMQGQNMSPFTPVVDAAFIQNVNHGKAEAWQNYIVAIEEQLRVANEHAENLRDQLLTAKKELREIQGGECKP